jgi:hypothetical protein
MMLLIRELRREVEQLRREVQELKANQSERSPRAREGERPQNPFGPGREGFRPRRPEQERGRERDAVERERDRTRQGERGESEEGREALEKAREERNRQIDSAAANLGRVSGLVIINGQPLAGAKVEFIPQKGKPSSGVTDQNGRYSLKSSQDIPGAALGTHQVSISTATEEGAKETIPPKYNAATSLAAEVVEGNNEFIFELTK